MSRYRVAYTNLAKSGYDAMPAALRRRFDREVDTMANDPYGTGKAIRGDKDRREAVLAGVITHYEVSDSVLTVTMLRVLHA